MRPLPGQSGTLVLIDDKGVQKIRTEQKTEGEAILKAFVENLEPTDA